MPTISIVDGDDEADGMPRIASRITFIGGLSLLILAGAAALLVEPLPTAAPDCAAIESAGPRLRCYDSFAHRPALPPARGALAPTLD